MTRSRLGLIAAGVVAVIGLAGCSSTGDSSSGLDTKTQQQIAGLQERVASLETRVTWLEVIGRKAIEAAPTAYTEQLSTEVAALQSDFATAQANAAAVADSVAAQKAAAQTAITDAQAAVAAAVEAEKTQDANLVQAIEDAGAKLAAAKVAVQEFVAQVKEALASRTATASPSATTS